MNIFVFRTTLNTEEDVLSVAPVLNEHKQILKWSVDLEDSEKVLRIECEDITISAISAILECKGYSCSELEYLPEEMERKYSCIFPLPLFLSICVIFIWVTFSATCHAQVITDSLANDFRTSMAKNFSRFRTVNLYWETKMAHDYNFSLNGNEVEKMRKKNRKGIKVKNEDGKTDVEPIVKQDSSPIPFFNVGVSYSLFR